MYTGKAGRSLFTDTRGKKKKKKKKNDDLLHVQSAEKCVSHHAEKRGGLFLQQKGFCFSKQAPYLSSLHHFLPLTSKVNGRNTKLRLDLSELLTFGACLLLLTPARHHEAKEVSMVERDYLNVENLFVCVVYSQWSLLEQHASRCETEKKGNFPSKRVCQRTKQRKEQQWVKQWGLVFQHSTCPIIYTPLTGAILKSVIDGKLFVSKRLARSELTSAGVRVINDLWPYCVEVAN